MTDLVDVLSGEESDLTVDEAFPAWVDPMLATLVDERCLAYRKGTDVRLMSRNRSDRSDRHR